MSEEEQINQDRKPETCQHDCIQEIYGEQPALTRIEADVEILNGDRYGRPHLEATEVRVEEELDENGRNRERSLEDAIEYAESALATLSEERAQNVFGDKVTGVLFDALNLFIAVYRKPQENQKLVATTSDLAHMLQEAVNTISFMLMNIADSDDHCSPESGEIYSDIVCGALYLEEAIKMGVIPDNYGKDRVAELIEAVKTQEARQIGEDQRPDAPM